MAVFILSSLYLSRPMKTVLPTSLILWSILGFIRIKTDQSEFALIKSKPAIINSLLTAYQAAPLGKYIAPIPGLKNHSHRIPSHIDRTEIRYKACIDIVSYGRHNSWLRIYPITVRHF